MAETTLQTTRLRELVRRLQAGERQAREELLAGAGARLERLARKMLRDYPTVARFEQTGDVLNNALLRLLRSLEDVQPRSVRDFYALAAVQLRRELLDLTKHYRSARAGGGRLVALPAAGGEGECPAPVADDELERWGSFHLEVEKLPAQEREVVSLVFYHGWGTAEIAELFGVDERTVRRWWHRACQRLYDALGGQLPAGLGSA